MVVYYVQKPEAFFFEVIEHGKGKDDGYLFVVVVWNVFVKFGDGILIQLELALNSIQGRLLIKIDGDPALPEVWVVGNRVAFERRPDALVSTLHRVVWRSL